MSCEGTDLKWRLDDGLSAGNVHVVLSCLILFKVLVCFYLLFSPRTSVVRFVSMNPRLSEFARRKRTIGFLVLRDFCISSRSFRNQARPNAFRLTRECGKLTSLQVVFVILFLLFLFFLFCFLTSWLFCTGILGT